MTLEQLPFTHFFFVIFLALLIGGCGKPERRFAHVEAVHASSQKGTPPDFTAQTDESLTPEEYIRLGLPAHDREWHGEDMAKAEKVLTDIGQKNGRQLPRYQSERSGKVFARLTSSQNMELARNKSLPIDARIPQALTYLQAYNQITKLYLSAFLKKEVRDSELVELFGAQFRLVVVILELVDEFLPTLKKDDPKYPVRMQGMEGLKQGLAGVVSGGFQTLTEREYYRASELVRLVSYMQETFPQIIPQLPPGSMTEALLRLDKMQEDAAMKDLQPGLEELRSKVKAAMEKKKGNTEEGKKQQSLKSDANKVTPKFLQFDAGEADATGWYPAKSTHNGFTVLLPGKFVEYSMTAKNVDGAEVTTTVLETTVKGIKYLVLSMIMSSGKMKGDPLDTKEYGKIIDKKDVKLGDISGVEFRLKNTRNTGWTRKYATDSGLYQLIVEAPPRTEFADIEENAKRFFDSFQLQQANPPKK